jgi:phytoene desaturase
LAASAYLAQSGYDVTVFENDAIGGRARQLKDGFTFDMGPSWYWMPDVLSVSLLILEKNYRL